MSSFGSGLDSALDIISKWATGELVFQLCHASYRDLLERGAPLREIATRDGIDEQLLEAFLSSLAREGIVEWHGDTVRFSPRGEQLCRYSGWFTLFIGGYGRLFRNVDSILHGHYDGPRRDGRYVGIGSCLISQYDAIPLTCRLMARTRPHAEFVVDCGCGAALSLVSLCEAMPHLRAIGVEENAESCMEGRRVVAARGMEARIEIVNSDIRNFVPPESPDFIMFSFVLHELVAQLGEDGLVAFLRGLGARFPESYLLAIEVDDASKSNPDVFESGIGRGYYNYYFMLHPFTNQRLLSDSQWQRIFESAGYRLIDRQIVDPEVDSSGLEIGYVLAPRG